MNGMMVSFEFNRAGCFLLGTMVGVAATVIYIRIKEKR